MNDHNSVSLVGRLTRDGELKYIPSGLALLKFSLAVNRSKKEGDGYKDIASFFDCVLWGKMGESLAQYLAKGKQVVVSGSLEQERWEQDGAARSRVVVNVQSLQLLGGDKKSEKPEARAPDGDGFQDDIPF
jgi:single-strand DNA-binding protein